MDDKRIDSIRLTKQDAKFIEDLIIQCESHIKNVVYGMLSADKRYLAEDIISELHLLMCKKVDTLKTHPSPKAWALVAARHVTQGAVAKNRKNANNVPLEEVESYIGTADVFEDAVYEMWLENKVPEKLIAKLSKREREIYQKIYIEEKQPQEVAVELDLSVNAVHNIHKNLRDKIKYDIEQKNF